MTDTAGLPRPLTQEDLIKNPALARQATLLTFLDDMESSPDDDGLRLIFADWCQDNGMPDVAECLRWTAARGKHARCLGGEWIFYDLDVVTAAGNAGSSSAHSDLPSPVFKMLKGWMPESETGDSSEHGRKAYDSFRQAEEAMWAAWIDARRNGWVPR